MFHSLCCLFYTKACCLSIGPQTSSVLLAIYAPFTRVRTNLCTDKNFLSSTLRLHGTGGAGRIFERLSVQVWDLKKAGQLFDRHGSVFVRTRVNTRTVQLFPQIARLRPGIKYRNWSKLCTDPCKPHCNRICTEPCKQAVQEQNSSVQKFARARVNGALVAKKALTRHSIAAANLT